MVDILAQTPVPSDLSKASSLFSTQPGFDQLLARFFTDLHDTLMADPDAVVDWQLREDGTRFCFRVGLPYISSTDMLGSLEDPALAPGEHVLMSNTPDTDPVLGPGESVTTGSLAWETEHLCPLTYLTFKKLGLCYDVSQADQAALKLHLPDPVRDLIILAADHPEATTSRLYWQFHALFAQKEQQILFLGQLLQTIGQNIGQKTELSL